MKENSSATVMLGLEGMAVLAVSERDGEVEYAIETTATIRWCPVCGAQARLQPVDPATGMAEVAGIAAKSVTAWSQRSTQLREWAAGNLAPG